MCDPALRILHEKESSSNRQLNNWRTNLTPLRLIFSLCYCGTRVGFAWGSCIPTPEAWPSWSLTCVSGVLSEISHSGCQMPLSSQLPRSFCLPGPVESPLHMCSFALTQVNPHADSRTPPGPLPPPLFCPTWSSCLRAPNSNPCFLLLCLGSTSPEPWFGKCP